MSSRCENTTRSLTCNNAYQESFTIGPQSHFSCPHTCVMWNETCRGLDWRPEEPEVCGPNLRCPIMYRDENDRFQLIYRHEIQSSAGSTHHYCLGDSHINNNQYDSIDRDDEKQLGTEGSALDINITLFTPCNTSDGFNDPGVRCATSRSDCKESYLWCNEAKADQCNTASGLISTTDSRLCSNPEVWRNVSCNQYYSDGTVAKYGIRCQGSTMGCAYPGYTAQELGNELYPKCSDRSDEIFEEGLTCRQHLQKQKWSDHHNCQSSCAVPGPDCLACSNSSYVRCARPGQPDLCISPELVCDGHPQCPGGEDENLDLENCHQKYIENHIIEPYASFRCKSRFYSTMEIYATPCDRKIECFDGLGKSL